jgi:hypothetical protein
MVSIHGRETAAMLDVYDFSPFQTIVDVGGGNGSLVRETLERLPHLSAIVFDLPGVVGRAVQNLEKSGLAGRCRAVGGDFFNEIPGGGDAYLLRHVIHDWDDAKSLQILRNVRASIPRTGKLLLVESVIPPGNAPFPAKLLDLTMLVMPGGQERTEEEYRTLLAAAGFRLTKIVPTSADVSVIESEPV